MRRKTGRSAAHVVPVLEEIAIATVTQASLARLHDLLHTLVKYRTHDDVDVKIKTKQILGAWKAIYKTSNHESASAAQFLRTGA